MDILERLLEHDQWATSQVLAKAQPLTRDQLDREFDIGHRTLWRTIDHILTAREGWVALMTRVPPPEHPESRPIAYQIERHERLTPAFNDLARHLRDEGRFDDTFEDFYGEPTTFGSGILQSILHNEGHRTEAVHILTRLGIPGEELEFDYGLWDFVRRGLFTG
ncbi:MAG TPA: DinB family protein [Thermomicrobiales bacterium]|nr:DinB family protein [Thermomicrobiales bacterium]